VSVRKTLPLLAGLVVLAAVSQGCSSETEPDPFAVATPVTFTQQALNVDQHFADSVKVEDARIVVTADASNEALLARMKPGTILAGNRESVTADLATAKNPYGFLRRVVAVKREGATAIVDTEPAELADWIENGDIDFSQTASLLTGADTKSVSTQGGVQIRSNGAGQGAATSPLNQTLEGKEQTSPAGVKFRPIVKLSNATLSLNAKYDGAFQVRRNFGIPTQVKFRSRLTLDPVVAADITAGAKGMGDLAEVWVGPSAVIPIAAPIPLTVRFQPELKCTLSASGSVTATVRVELKGHGVAGFEGSAGLSGFDLTDLSESPTLQRQMNFVGVEGKATLSATCEVLAVPVLLAFDAVGIKGRVGPFVSLNGEVCASYNQNQNDPMAGFSIYEQHGLSGSFAGRVQIPFLNKGKDFDLVSVKLLKSEPIYLVGKKDQCTIGSKDSCAGKKDGFYCSELTSYGGYYCEAGSIALGNQCPTGKTCTGGTKTTIDCK